MAAKPISVLLTGANRGLGLEMVKQMMEIQGLVGTMFACCRDPKGAKAQELRDLADKYPGIIKILCMDAADLKSIKQAAAEVGSHLGQNGLNLVINNAGIAPLSTFFKSTLQEMQNCYITNAVGPMHIIQEFFPLLRIAAQKSEMQGMSCRKAAVVNISTIASSIEKAKVLYPSPFPALPYRASKAALNMIVACAAVELQKDEILCTLLHPGWVRTDMGGPEGDIDAPESVQGMLEVMKSMTEKHHGGLVDYKGKTIPW